MSNDFKNPYAEVEDCKRVFITLSTEDYNLLKCTRPPMGTLSITIGILVNTLCKELRKNGITDVSKIREFEQFVANLAISSTNGN